MVQVRHTMVALGALAALGLAGCGGGSIYGGGGGGPKIEVGGNIDAVFPDRDGRNIVVFVYKIKDENPDCTLPELPENKWIEESRALEDPETVFQIRKTAAGRIVVAFLLDNPGKDADGKIDPGDPVAVLNDPECVLDDVPKNYIVDISNVRINFDQDTDAPTFPEPGRAEAMDIVEGPQD